MADEKYFLLRARVCVLLVHVEARARCTEFLPTTLMPQQTALVKQRDVQSLR